jgi:hypothetical protein
MIGSEYKNSIETIEEKYPIGARHVHNLITMWKIEYYEEIIKGLNDKSSILKLVEKQFAIEQNEFISSNIPVEFQDVSTEEKFYKFCKPGLRESLYKLVTTDGLYPNCVILIQEHFDNVNDVKKYYEFFMKNVIEPNTDFIFSNSPKISITFGA